MKRMNISVMVEDESVDEVSAKVVELVESKKGKVDIQISEAPPAGSGATLAGVA